MEINIESKIEVKPEAVEALNQLISESIHPSPLLAILYKGTGKPGEKLEDIEMEWVVTTVDAKWTTIIDCLKFNKQGFIFYSTYEDLEILKDKLNNMIIDYLNNKIIINFK